jgi:hypothetical protein
VWEKGWSGPNWLGQWTHIGGLAWAIGASRANLVIFYFIFIFTNLQNIHQFNVLQKYIHVCIAVSNVIRNVPPFPTAVRIPPVSGTVAVLIAV